MLVEPDGVVRARSAVSTAALTGMRSPAAGERFSQREGEIFPTQAFVGDETVPPTSHLLVSSGQPDFSREGLIYSVPDSC